VVLFAHLLLATSRTWFSRVVWVGCLLAVAWGHGTFFNATAKRAGEISAVAVPIGELARVLQAELASIEARPLAVVAAATGEASGRAAAADAGLTRCEQTTPGQCSRAKASARTTQARFDALSSELAQAQRVVALRGILAKEAARRDTAQADAGMDPVAVAVAALTGTTASAWSTGMSMLTALGVELGTALLWSVALSKPSEIPPPEARMRRKFVAAEQQVLLPYVEVLGNKYKNPGKRTSYFRTSKSKKN
jgi:hypothetical protein